MRVTCPKMLSPQASWTIHSACSFHLSSKWENEKRIVSTEERYAHLVAFRMCACVCTTLFISAHMSKIPQLMHANLKAPCIQSYVPIHAIQALSRFVELTLQCRTGEAKWDAVSAPNLNLQLASISKLKHIFVLTNANSAQESKQLKEGPGWKDMKREGRRSSPPPPKPLIPSRLGCVKPRGTADVDHTCCWLSQTWVLDLCFW